MSQTVLELSDADVSGALKIVYSGWREKLFPLIVPLLAQLERAKSGGMRNYRWGGAGVNFDAVLSRPAGMTASRSGWLPPHHVAIEKQGTIGIERLYVSRQIDGLAIPGTQTKEMAFISLARKILEEAKAASRLGMQEVVHGNALGIKCAVTSVTDNDTFVVSSPYGLVNGGRGALLLAEGMFIEVLNAAGVTSRGKSYVTSFVVAGDNATVQLQTAAAANGGVQVGDVLVAATTNDHSYGVFPNGLQNMLNYGGAYALLHGLTSATYSRWNTTRLAVGTDVPDMPTELDIWELMTRVAGVSGHDAKLNPREFIILTSPGISKKVAESFLGQRRFMPENQLKIKGGWSAVQIFGIPLLEDFWIPVGTVYLVHLPSMSWIDAKDWGQVQYENAGAWRWIDGRDAFQINWGAYINLACPQRNAHGMITGYTDPGRYDFVM